MYVDDTNELFELQHLRATFVVDSIACKRGSASDLGSATGDTLLTVGAWKQFVRWRHGRKVGLVRVCTECGYTWPMPHRAATKSHATDGIELTPHLQSAAHLIGQQVLDDATSDAQAKYELDFCAGCGSGRFVEYPADDVPGTDGQPPTPATGS